MARFLLLSDNRSGSTLLANLLNTHTEVAVTREILNHEEIIPTGIDVLQHLYQELGKLTKKVVGVKLFPCQIYGRKLKFNTIIEHLGITHVIVLWRENFLEMVTSKIIANMTGIWYASVSDPIENHQVHFDVQRLSNYYREIVQDWEQIGNQWPVQVVPVFLRFEDLLEDRIGACNKILAAMSCKQTGHELRSYSKRQNPSSLIDKISNWAELPEEFKNLQLDVHGILKPRMEANLQVSKELLKFVPDREPPSPHDGWRYRVAEPYMPKKLKENVYEAIEYGMVSSAGFWATKMTEKLKEIFQVPVALPCSNGFTALLLAMQTAKLGPGDEVIVPSLTMVAVPNSVKYVGATPVFADSAPTNYNPGWEDIEKVATPNTKAVILTHTYGVPVPIEDIERIVLECKVRGWLLVEDISECVGIKVINPASKEVKFLGTFGDYACASLYANKIVHAGDGGFILAKDPSVAYRLKSLANHGFTPSYHFVHYEVSINGKINGVGAAMAVGCLDSLDYIMKHRATLASIYRALLSDTPLKIMPFCGVNDTPWVFGVECKEKTERTKLRAFMAKYGIETRDYFFPLHLQPAYRNASTNINVRLPNAELFGSTGFYLPTFTNLRKDDINFITAVIRAFYGKPGVDTTNNLKPPPKRSQMQRILIKPGTFDLAVQRVDEDGSVHSVRARGHPLTRAIILGMEIRECLIEERWDSMQIIMNEFQICLEEIPEAETKSKLENHFKPYIDYIQSSTDFETARVKPWLSEDLDSEEYVPCQEIQTTTDPETLQLLTFLVKTKKPRTIWEIGCWVGHTTVRLAIASQMAAKIFACDCFKWQKWMNHFLQTYRRMKPDDSFLNRFKVNTEPYSDIIIPVCWPFNISSLPEELQNSPDPDLIFVDMSQEDSDLEHIWSLMSPRLVANRTILVYNGLNRSSLPFFTRHANQLKPLAKPRSIAKAFLFVDSTVDYDGDLPPNSTCVLLPRKLCFHNSPNWNHHHKNAFGVAIDLLRKKFHDDSAQTLFIPAVEETLCDKPELLLTKPWIGIIHTVLHYPEQFYTPDLERLCKPAYQNGMKNCKGLFTLTQFQAEYLQQNLPMQIRIPIQPLAYPILHSLDDSPSQVLKMWSEGAAPIDLLLVGGFARDFELFFKCKIPPNMRKVLLVGEWSSEIGAASAPADITILPRLNDEEYEKAMRKSIVFLPLKYEGAANTIILECIDRNVPIVVPSMTSCLEYIGPDYPLQYDHKNNRHFDFVDLITEVNVRSAVDYLQKMDKTKFQPETFVQTVENSGVLLAVSPKTEDAEAHYKFDVTISICSYKRTHNLPEILGALWKEQDFCGRVQIIVWNNNEARSKIVNDICAEYSIRSTNQKSLEVINSTVNYFCAVRLALPALMKSDVLLICDDDIIPSSKFISFFMEAHAKHPIDVLCLRGHVFLPHNLDLENPTNAWTNYEDLRFKSDEDPEQLIHFVHADACLIPKMALRECASVEMPDPAFNLVDDYWLAYILNHKFKRNLRKLTTARLKTSVIKRTDDSETIGLALHTRPEVKDARTRLYLHHMLQGWPSWSETPFLNLTPEKQAVLTKEKKQFWSKPFIGFNVSSRISENDVQSLVGLGIQCVRIGAVQSSGISPGYAFEFCGFADNHEKELEKLNGTIDLLEKHGINMVLTLHKDLANPITWKYIATQFAGRKNVVGYDLINEPFTAMDKKMHCSELLEHQPNGIPVELNIYLDIIQSIREVDSATPILIEPSFWAHIDAVRLLPQNLLEEDSNLIISFHFYEPRLFTQRTFNTTGRFRFPGEVPVFNQKLSETVNWNKELIKKKFVAVQDWTKSISGLSGELKINLGEFGICRDIPSADEYLRSILETCVEIGMSGFLYSFRDDCWDAMNYEFGQSVNNFNIILPENGNILMQIIKEGVEKMKKSN